MESERKTIAGRSLLLTLLSLLLVGLLCLSQLTDATTPLSRSTPRRIVSSSDDSLPLLAMVTATFQWTPPCGDGYFIMVSYSNNQTSPVEFAFELPFANTIGGGGDGVVALDETNRIIYTFLASAGQDSFNGGFLVGMIETTEAYYPRYGIISAPFVGDFLVHSLQFYNGTIWALGSSISTGLDYFVTINPITGAVNKLFALPKDQVLAFPSIIDNNGIYYAVTAYGSSNIWGYLYSVNLTSSELISIVPIDITNPLARCSFGLWSYDSTTGNTYTLCYNEKDYGTYLAVIDPKTMNVTVLGNKPVIEAPYQYSGVTFAVNTEEGSVYFVVTAEDSLAAWLIKVDLTTGEKISQLEILGTNPSFMTYLPWF